MLLYLFWISLSLGLMEVAEDEQRVIPVRARAPRRDGRR
jgi:hypothetical protein